MFYDNIMKLVADQPFSSQMGWWRRSWDFFVLEKYVLVPKKQELFFQMNKEQLYFKEVHNCFSNKSQSVPPT